MKVDIIQKMKLLAMISFLPMATLAVTVEPLPPPEFAIAFGYDCGQWFVREGEDVRAEESVCSEQMYARRELAIRYKGFAPDWDLVKVVRRGLSASEESVSLVEERKHFILFVR